MKSIIKEIQYFKSTIGLFILSVPAIIYFFIFSYVPMFGIIIAFKNYNYAKGF